MAESGKGFKKYSDEDRRRAVQIWVDMGGTRHALKEALPEIHKVTGMKLPADGRSLRNWRKKYKTKPSDYDRNLFPQFDHNIIQINNHKSADKTSAIDFQRVNNIFFSLFGSDFKHSVGMLNLILKERLNIGDKAVAAKVLIELREMNLDSVENLISKIIKRIRENITASIELSEYKPADTVPGDEFVGRIRSGMESGEERPGAV